MVTPLLSSGSLSAKAALLLEDYRNELTFPSLSQQGQLLAVDYAYTCKTQMDILKDLYSQYLITPEAGDPEFKVSYPRKTGGDSPANRFI